MKIGEYQIVFGKYRTRIKVWGTDNYRSKVREQRWNVPSLGLYGYVETEFEGIPHSLITIKQNIESEVQFDLEQRKTKRRNSHLMEESCYINRMQHVAH